MGGLELKMRPGTVDDAEVCGRICYEAFNAISSAHGFPCDFPSTEVAIRVLRSLLSHSGFYSVVAESGGRVVGSNFLDERSVIAGVGPITVDPGVQNSSVGRQLMLDVLERAAAKSFPGVRLHQAAYHNRSLSLYTKLGFDPRELMVTLQGPPIRDPIDGYSVRSATEADLGAANRVCVAVHGHDRGGELLDAIRCRTARVVEHRARIVGYTTGVAFFMHSVSESNEALRALIGDAQSFGGPGFLLPAQNAEIFRWCLAHGLRVVQTMALMTVGLYNEPRGAYLPSVLY